MTWRALWLGAALLLQLGAAAGQYAPYLPVDSGDPMSWAENPEPGFSTVTLAFLGGTGGCKIGWRGLKQTLPDDLLADGKTRVAALVQRFQQQGVSVILSFGGWLGADPAGHCGNDAELTALYQQVIDLYQVSALDFDIEGPAALDRKAHDQRNRALLALKRANPALTISFTLPVRPHGIPKGDGLEVLESARDTGYSPDIISLMTMDYFFDPGAAGMERASERALDNALAQIRQLGLTAKLGVIPMIGQNDNAPEIFTLEDARKLMAYLAKKPDFERLSMWSIDRDNGHCPGQRKASDHCSGIAQEDGAFSQIFARYNQQGKP